MDDRYLGATALLDFEGPELRGIVEQQRWIEVAPTERIGAVYDFVRNGIPFGYNASDDLPASAIWADGYGQCNTKTTLLMALLRGSGIGCRLRGATIGKRLQYGVMVEPYYWFAPHSILHSWAEVFAGGRWVGLEGVILDAGYLDGLRATLGRPSGPVLGYGVGTEDLADPPVEWCGTDTCIQVAGIDQDFGVFDDPDAFYRLHGVNARGVKGWLYANIMRKAMNRRVRAIRRAAVTD